MWRHPSARSLLHALRARAGPGVPAYSVGIEREGVAIPAAALEPTDSSVPTIDLEIPANSEWHWSGGLNAPRSGRYTLALQASPIGEDPAAPWRAGGIASLSVEGTEVVAIGGSFGGDASLLPTADGLANATSDLDLRTGSPRWIAIKARAGARPMRLRLAWITPDAREAKLAAAVAAARSARTAIVVAWDEAGEGRDRQALDLPWQQDRLIEAVARANPRTIVVLATAAPVLMPWVPQTAAVLETWYSGVEGADALSAILLGEADPGGRLPVTFPADPGQTPTSSPERYPGVDGVADYSEGLLVGYRWYDATGSEPLFPFGHGLSYSRFAYSGSCRHRARRWLGGVLHGPQYGFALRLRGGATLPWPSRRNKCIGATPPARGLRQDRPGCRRRASADLAARSPGAVLLVE